MKSLCTCLSHKEGLIISNGSEKNKKRPCIAKRTISSKKMLYAIFFNSRGSVVQVPCPSGHTVTGRFYKNSVLKKWKSFTIRNDQAKDGQESTFYMTTLPLISVRLLSLFFGFWKVNVLNHPTYSPDLSPCDFFLFPRLKKMLSGKTSRFSWQRYLSVSPTNTIKRLFICFSWMGKMVTKMCFSKEGILWRFVIKICLIKRSTEVIRTQWQNFLQDPRIILVLNLNSAIFCSNTLEMYR